MGFFSRSLFGGGTDAGLRIDAGPTLPKTLDERRADIIRNWTYYHGRDRVAGRSQWDYLHERFETMPRREIEDIENHVQICVNRLRRLLVNSWRGFEFDGGEAGAALREVFRRNHWPQLLNLAVLYGHVTGDAFIKLVPTHRHSRYGPVRFVLLDTESVEVTVSPHDRDKIQEVVISYDFFEDENGKPKRRSFLERIDDLSSSVFIDGEYSDDLSSQHMLYFIPVVHIRHMDAGGGVYGESLVSRLTDAQDTINMLASDLLDIVRYDGHKTTIFQNVNIDKGASRDGLTTGEIDLSIGKGLAVRGDGKVYKLDQQHDLGAALQEYERKLDAFYDLAGVPRITREMVSHLGNLSGRAIERLYQDAIEATREAQRLYGESFEELARKAAVMMDMDPPEVNALWNADVITPDIDTLEKEYRIGARSLRSVMRKLGIADIEGMMEEMRGEAS